MLSGTFCYSSLIWYSSSQNSWAIETAALNYELFTHCAQFQCLTWIYCTIVLCVFCYWCCSESQTVCRLAFGLFLPMMWDMTANKHAVLILFLQYTKCILGVSSVSLCKEYNLPKCSVYIVCFANLRNKKSQLAF